MSITITDTQKFTASIQPVDARGNPASVEGVPAWTVSDEALLSLTPAEDGLSAVVLADGPLGVGQVVVTADADLGEGVKTIQGILDVTVVAGEAVALTVAASTPEEQ